MAYGQERRWGSSFVGQALSCKVLLLSETAVSSSSKGDSPIFQGEGASHFAGPGNLEFMVLKRMYVDIPFQALESTLSSSGPQL